MNIIKKNLWRLKRQPVNNDNLLIQQLSAELEALRQELRYVQRELICSDVVLVDALIKEKYGRPVAKKICFVGLYSYSLFNPRTDFVFGGSEVRTWLLSTGLAADSQNDVSFIVYDHGQHPIEIHQNVKVYAHSFYKLFIPVPALNMLDSYWQVARIGDEVISEERLAIYKRVNADIYIMTGVNNLSAEVSAFCQRERRKMVIMLGSDIDLSDVFYPGSQQSTNYGARGDWGYYALTKADLVIAQTAAQADLLKNRFQRDSITIKNPMDLSSFAKTTAQDNTLPMVLWVGKSDNVKRPEICLALASQYPQYSFVMIMNRSNAAVFEQILQNTTPNVKIIEFVPFDQIEAYFAYARVLINTSVFEGFPNTFLQAGKYGVPVVSLKVDPDNFIHDHQCGIVADGSMEFFVNGFQQLMNDSEFHQTCAANIRHYVKENHELTSKVRELNRAISKLLE